MLALTTLANHPNTAQFISEKLCRYLLNDNPPPAFTKTVTFEDLGNGRTQLTLLCTFDTEADRNAIIRRGFSVGTNQSFDKLEAYLATQ